MHFFGACFDSALLFLSSLALLTILKKVTSTPSLVALHKPCLVVERHLSLTRTTEGIEHNATSHPIPSHPDSTHKPNCLCLPSLRFVASISLSLSLSYISYHTFDRLLHPPPCKLAKHHLVVWWDRVHREWK